MTKKLKSEPASPAAKRVSTSAKLKPTGKAAGAKKAAAKTKAPEAKTPKASPKAKSAEAAAPKRAVKQATKIEKPKANAKILAGKAPKAKSAGAKSKLKIESISTAGEPILDPIGDTTDGEGRTYIGDTTSVGQAEMDAFKAETAIDAQEPTFEAGLGLAARKATEKRERENAENAAGRESGVDESANAGGERPAGKLENGCRRFFRRQALRAVGTLRR